LEERKLWEPYMKAFKDMLSATSTAYAPWYVVPADHKWYRNLVVARVVVEALESMRLKTPPPPADVDFAKLRIR
jgi:polyphosphate kinase 2 (PPK2 family)